MMGDSAAQLIEQLGLAAHPEGGWYRETWRGDPRADGRAQGTAIIFLLRAGEASHWHTVDAAELWLKGRPGYRPWFRYPFLDEGGRDKAKRDAVREGLKAGHSYED